LTRLEKFREACAAVEDAQTEIYGAKVDAMHEAYDDLKMEPDIIVQALTLVDDPNPMVRYMVATIIRPTMPERADAMLKVIAEKPSGTASLWAM
jgi:hypothetical protein